MNPTSWPAIGPDQVDIFRNTRCQHYEKCLSHAAKKGWPSFVCFSCPNKEAYQDTSPNKAEDYIPLLKLCAAIFNPTASIEFIERTLFQSRKGVRK